MFLLRHPSPKYYLFSFFLRVLRQFVFELLYKFEVDSSSVSNLYQDLKMIDLVIL